MFKKFLNRFYLPVINEIKSINTRLDILTKIQMQMIEDLLINYNNNHHNSKHIFKYPTQMYSQNFEDSIIAEILKRVGYTNKIFVEIGIEDGNQNNTRFLLEQGWKGIWIEADSQNVAKVKQKFSNFIKSGQLIIIEQFITTANINKLIDIKEVDLLSIDVDMNTSHIWRALELKARVAVIEYNASIHPSIEYEIPYNEDSVWDGSNHFGASLKTLERIGQSKEMALVGCDFMGVNAFFVNKELVQDKFLSPYTSEQHFEPARYYLIKHRGHPSY